MPRMQDRDHDTRAGVGAWIMGTEGLNVHGQLSLLGVMGYVDLGV